MSMNISISSESIHTPDAAMLLSELASALVGITGCSGNASFDLDDMIDSRSCFAVARDDNGIALGCGAIRPFNASTAEMKRVYVRNKNSGVGKKVVQFLEQCAVELGYSRIILETRIVNEKAVSFYLRNGYTIIQNYGKYAGHEEDVCFEKILQ